MVALVIIPSISSIQNIGEKIRQQDQKLSQKKSSGFDLEKTKLELEQARQQAGQLDAIFVSTGKELELISQLEILAQKHRINAQITPDLNIKPTGANTQRLPIKMNANGNYLDLLKFISDIESLTHYFNVKQLTFKKSGNEAAGVALELDGQDYIYLSQ
jgi:Tfp pilus assembly protein PilO